jgi:hypothetical protein
MRNCLDVYSLGLDNVTATLDILVCLLKVDCCRHVFITASVGVSSTPEPLLV